MSGLVYLALGIGFVVAAAFCPVVIRVFHKIKTGQFVREEGPQAHLKKAGTPTMGGVAILIAFAAGTLVAALCGFAGSGRESIEILIFTCAFGVIGLGDDFLKTIKKQSEGLKAWQKMGLQIIVTIVLVLYIGANSVYGTVTIIPFVGGFDIGGWYWPLAVIAVLGTVNGANFTDGLDGLAGSVTVVISAFIAVVSAQMLTGVMPAALAMIGALLGFLMYNIHPAKLFMGDTGSLALGGFVATSALVLRIPVFIILIAFIYLAEIVSVMMQVSYFKLTHGKRIFRMTPIHHHFELGGWSENKVVIVFTLVTLVLCVIAYFGLRVAVYGI